MMEIVARQELHDTAMHNLQSRYMGLQSPFTYQYLVDLWGGLSGQREHDKMCCLRRLSREVWHPDGQLPSRLRKLGGRDLTLHEERRIIGKMRKDGGEKRGRVEWDNPCAHSGA